MIFGFSPARSSAALLAASTLLGSPALAQDGAATSPFLPAGGAAAPTVTENAPLELRGIVGLGSDRMFNIFDPSSNTSVWVRMNEAGQPFAVRAHDEASDTVSLDYNGRTLSLKLPEARIAPMAAAPAAPVAVGGRGRGGGGDPTNNNNGPRELTAEQARQLENVAAEVARRRALRAAGQPTAQPSGNQRNQR